MKRTKAKNKSSVSAACASQKHFCCDDRTTRYNKVNFLRVYDMYVEEARASGP